jgi:hypothetical protein
LRVDRRHPDSKAKGWLALAFEREADHRGADHAASWERRL